MDKNKTKNLLGPYPNETFFMNTLMKLCTYMEKKTSKISKEASPTAKAEDLLFPLIYHISIRLMQSISFILKAPVLSKLSTPSCLPRTERKKNLSFLCISQAFGPNHFHDFYSNSKLFRPICEPVRLIHWTDSIQQVLLYPRKISMSFPGLENIILKLPGIISRNTVSFSLFII